MSLSEKLHGRNEELYAKLVSPMGASGTVEGEMLRATNKIGYRYYNDGDVFYEGYGAETAGQAHSFLSNSDEIPLEIRIKLRHEFQQAENFCFRDAYKEMLENIHQITVDYIEGKSEGGCTPSDVDMLDFESEYEDFGEGIDWYEDDDDEEW